MTADLSPLYAKVALVAVVTHWIGDPTDVLFQVQQYDISKCHRTYVRVIEYDGNQKYGMVIVFSHESLVRDDQPTLRQTVERACRNWARRKDADRADG